MGILVLLVLATLFLVFAVRPYYQAHRAETTAKSSAERFFEAPHL
ncbi:hypothetical protein [Bifidobacterium psychraerophilum]|nr:hypothetical protein [Bifidobacterium psychraerophilum]